MSYILNPQLLMAAQAVPVCSLAAPVCSSSNYNIQVYQIILKYKAMTAMTYMQYFTSKHNMQYFTSYLEIT